MTSSSRRHAWRRHCYLTQAGLMCMIAATFACGGRQNADGSFYEGSGTGPPSLDILPSMPAEWDDLSSDLRFGWTLADVSFAYGAAPRPPSTEPEVVKTWAERTFAPWFAKKINIVERAREHLSEAAKIDSTHRIVSAAIIALLYEDVSIALNRLPLESTENVHDKDAPQFLRSYILHAQEAYEACAANARQADKLEHWSPFCETRAFRLSAKTGE